MDKKINTIRTRPRFKLETDLSKEDFELNLKTELQKIKRTDNLKIAIIIGPEGGIDKKEILQLKEVGAKTITLGQRILRTETASIVVISNIIYELEM